MADPRAAVRAAAADTNGDGKISVTDVMKLVNMVLNGSQIAFDVVTNLNDVTYGGSGSGSAMAGETLLWEE